MSKIIGDVYMANDKNEKIEKNDRKKINVNNRKRNRRFIGQRSTSPVKVAYYVQRMLERKSWKKKKLYILYHLNLEMTM